MIHTVRYPAIKNSSAARNECLPSNTCRYIDIRHSNKLHQTENRKHDRNAGDRQPEEGSRRQDTTKKKMQEAETQKHKKKAQGIKEAAESQSQQEEYKG